ncbi:MAG: phenylacetate-CoA oxygenase subunit PaaJ [Betaproteobacteria bacterium]|nr:phenylacetate-CoA oxygenase subunit PaaJ [Betaproteobacteria bacterium]
MNAQIARAWDLLEVLTDPEIPVVTLRELGILRDVREGPEGLDVVITPTYSGCPAMSQIQDDVQSCLQQSGIAARVITQLAPAWTTDWMSPEAKDKLRAYGIAPPHACPSPSGSVVQFAARSARHPAGSELLAVACPQCQSLNTTETSHFGSTACKALYRCLDCLEPFDYFKPY